MRKRLILLFLTCFLLSGCGEVSDKEDLLDYAESTYGDCELVSETLTEKANTLILKDNEYCFEYEVSSYMSNVNVDGSSFGEVPSKSSSFTSEYVSCFEKKYKDKFKDLDCTIEFSSSFVLNNSMSLMFVTIDNKDVDYDSMCKSLISMIKEYDTREYFSNASISIYVGDTSIGAYSIDTEEFTSTDDIRTVHMLESAYNIMNTYQDIDIYSADELTFKAYDVLSVDDIEGLSDEQLGDYDGFDRNNIGVWYFTYDGDDWLIADCLISPNGNRYVTKLN